jgi:hypothetical protein
MQAVNEAVERCLDGRRRWNDDDPPEVGAFLCGVIKSIISDEFKKASRDKAQLAGETIDDVIDPASISGVHAVDAASADGEADVSAVCAAVEACTKGDDDLELFRLAVLDGHTKRENIATAIGWESPRVTAARTKLQRRLIKEFPAQFAAAKKKRRAS